MVVSLNHTDYAHDPLPPMLVHQLRARSYHQLRRMAAEPSKRGFGSRLRHQIPLRVAREKTLVEKAITASYLCSYLADHLLLAQKEAMQLIDRRSMTPTEEQTVWEKSYADVVRTVIRDLPDAGILIKTMNDLDSYTRLSPSLHDLRRRHWMAMRRMVYDKRVSSMDTENMLEEKIETVLNSPCAADVKARKICLSAALLADIELNHSHRPWMGIYERIMIDIYPEVVKHPDVLAAILYLD